VFESIAVDGYALYMRDKASSGFSKTMGPGIWLVLGVNGLGKSTLLLLMKSLLLGKVRLAEAGFKGESQSSLLPSDTHLFSARVVDGAANAKATAIVSFGKTKISISRRMKDLKLISFAVGKTVSANDAKEESLQEALCAAVGIGSFENVVRLFEKCVFSLETRAELIWDIDAQYELFRATLVDAKTSKLLREIEGRIISADSFARNLSATVHGLKNRREKELLSQQSAPGIKANIASTTAQIDEANKNLLDTQRLLEQAEIERDDMEAAYFRSERLLKEFESAYEKIKYDGLRHSLASLSHNEKYTLLKLISKRVCPSCGNDVNQYAEELLDRQKTGRCMVCGNVHSDKTRVVRITSSLAEKAEKAYANFESEKDNLSKLRQNLEEKTQLVIQERERMAQIGDTIRALEKQHGTLTKQLPQLEQAKIESQSSQISLLQADIDVLIRQRGAAEEEMDNALQALREAVESKRKSLLAKFAKHSNAFFGNDVKLVYQPRSRKVGQAGRQLEFPVFEVDLKGVATSGEFARRNGDQVSLSQNHYLDLAFKMAFMDTVGSKGGTLIVDGPETSVDAVFAGLAGNMLSSYAAPEDSRTNQVIVASNIIDGDFLPNSLKKYRSEKTKRERTINLIEIAAPTPVLTSNRKAYAKSEDALFKGRSSG
jgi:energy-coupling factor transporter ATP-binding protein EcfA2